MNNFKGKIFPDGDGKIRVVTITDDGIETIDRVTLAEVLAAFEAVEQSRALDSALCAACNEPESNHTIRGHAFISRTPSQ